MGTISKRAKITGRTLQTAFKKLQDSDREEKGDDIYSGGWNNCSGIREVTPEKFNAINEMDKHSGAIAKCVCKPIVNSNKIKTTVTNFPVSGARKWVTKYVAISYMHGYTQQVVSELKQADAIKKARAFVEKYPDEVLTVEIVKVLEGQKAKVAEISYKKSVTERDGQWEIFGAMSY